MKIKITKIAKKTSGEYLDHKHCLLATAIRRKFPSAIIFVGYQTAQIDGVTYDFKANDADKIVKAAFAPVDKFKPFEVNLTP